MQGVGALVGPEVGLNVGTLVGRSVGLQVGALVGSLVGTDAVSYTHLRAHET